MNSGQLITAVIISGFLALVKFVGTYLLQDLNSFDDFQSFMFVNLIISALEVASFWFLRKLVLASDVQGIKFIADVLLGIYVIQLGLTLATFSGIFMYDFYDFYSYFARAIMLIIIFFHGKILVSKKAFTQWLKVYSGLMAASALLGFIAINLPHLFSINRYYTQWIGVVAAIILPIAFYQEYIRNESEDMERPDILDDLK